MTPSAVPFPWPRLLPVPCIPHTLSSTTEAEIAALSTLTASLAGRSALGTDHCGIIFHPVCSQHMLFAHNQTLCWFSAASCVPIQKCISVAVIHLEIHFFGKPFMIQACTNIQLEQTNLYFESLLEMFGCSM